MRKLILLLTLSLLTSTIQAQETTNPLLAKDVEGQTKWVDSVYNSLNLNEKIAQLYMVQVFSSQTAAEKVKVLNQIKNNKIGGIIYSKGGPYRQAKLNNELQAASKTPMLIGMDAEWGLSMRLDSTYSFPWNMTLGAVKDNYLIEQTGRQLGEHCKRLGVHFNFAPVVDINTNPNNPIIGNRSFGEDRDNVTEKATAFMKGMQSAGVLANAKHFPGHGDTEADSHLTLPTVAFDAKRIDSVELYPYRKLIKEGLSSVMVAHLNIPSLEPRQDYPSSISKNIVTTILKERLGFKGLIFTDALTMKGAADFKFEGLDGDTEGSKNTVGNIDLAAFLAGNDVMLMSVDVTSGIAKLEKAFNKGLFTEERLAHSVKKVLQAKYKVGLNNYRPISTYNLSNDLNRLRDDMLYEKLMEQAVTIALDSSGLLPLRHLETKKIAYVKLGDADGKPFLNTLKKYAQVNEVKADNLSDLVAKLQSYNTVIVSFHKSNASPWKSYKFSDKELTWLYEIARTNTVILDVFAKPYALLDLQTVTNIESVIVSYQNSKIAQETSAEIIFGALAAKGTLPVSAGPYFKVGDGIQTNSLERLSYSIPERVGLSSYRLKKIDSIANHAVNAGMTPGIQLIVARKGKVVYNKNFGKHTYSKGAEVVKDDDMYDVASLTKIVATLPLLMELEEQGIVSLNTKLSEIIPNYKSSNKKDITIKKMLSHYAQLKPWIPFYYATLDSVSKQPSSKYYRKSPSGKFNIKVANNLYMREDYQDSIPKLIKDTDLLTRLRYRYSDLPYYILKQYIESYYNKPLNELVQDHFYRSLGANNTIYNPYKTISNSRIPPTEEDDYYRFQKVQGYVHDMGAAMQGGVGGHAGVFSNANDIAKIMQMYLQKGYYGGVRYLKPETVDKFNTCYYCDKKIRRGIGFDKPQLGESGPTCGCLSMKSFGHSGFTGTYTWADPDEELIYVFMANRTYPSSKGKNMLLRADIRTNIQAAIYEAIIK
ncbi:glycoside hydrolase family 3 N-terminal domain-containing protein [Lacinutrix sp.]|uniref:glycoside hydrolase family 3 N-terminal domain-containing protein n=1 Tax=Lacinutrix sp. TaxID=1937692 RepID=UPI0025B85FDD|nr:glycoside hydrolase family 3 N-terminal domain-containing protein [Lacinutrix sp.]